MSKYKVKFYVSTDYVGSAVEEVIDLLEDYNYSEKEAEEIINNENELDNLYKEWLLDNIDAGYYVIDMENDEE